ncbi:MAG: (2Fe-2S)-binding protein, partial [Methylobacteriaceae bacterium]|nr:(2Fe-2S)-binding protein [Methylobacteriaceae bacterium]
GFFTPDRLARFVEIAPPRLAASPTDALPLLLNTGRVRDQWHTMTRTGLSPRLSAHVPAPFVAIHPDDATRFGLEGGGLARVTTAHGSAVLEVEVTTSQAPGSIFAPIHWSDATASAARVGALVQAVVDPVSGQPEAKATPAAVAPVAARWRGFLLSRAPLAIGRDDPTFPWWCRVTVDAAAGLLVATDLPPRQVAERAPDLFPGADLAEYADAAAGIYRCAAFVGERLEACLFIAPAEVRPHWGAVGALFQAGGRASALGALSGRDGSATGSAGPLVCSCFSVGLAAITRAIREGGATSPEAIGAALRAGTNCGSCVPELRRIIARELSPEAA